MELVALVNRAANRTLALQPAVAAPLLDQVEELAERRGFVLILRHARFLRVLAAAVAGDEDAVVRGEPALRERFGDSVPAEALPALRALARGVADPTRIGEAYDLLAPLAASQPDLAAWGQAVLDRLASEGRATTTARSAG
jgi:hypothetical protein